MSTPASHGSQFLNMESNPSNQGTLGFKTTTPLYPRRPQGNALGLVCTHSFPAIVGTADMMLKSAGVTLVGFEKTGSGFCTAVVRGDFSAVKIAVEAGTETAKQFEQFISSLVLPRPLPNLEVVLPISHRLSRLSQSEFAFQDPFRGQACGLIETRGFPAMVGAADAMLKSADVQLVGYETVGDGLCTAIVRGRVADVTVAIEAGMHMAERIGELHAIMVIPRPLDDLVESLPMASFEEEEEQLEVLKVPVALKEAERVLVELPERQSAFETLEDR